MTKRDLNIRRREHEREERILAAYWKKRFARGYFRDILLLRILLPTLILTITCPLIYMILMSDFDPTNAPWLFICIMIAFFVLMQLVTLTLDWRKASKKIKYSIEYQ